MALHLRQEAADEAQALPRRGRPRQGPRLLVPRGGRGGGGEGGGRPGQRRSRRRRRGLDHPDVSARDVDGAVGVTARPVAAVDDLVASAGGRGRHDRRSEPEHQNLPGLERRGPRADNNRRPGPEILVGAQGGRARGIDRGWGGAGRLRRAGRGGTGARRRVRPWPRRSRRRVAAGGAWRGP